MSIFNLYEAYNAIYDEDLREEIEDLFEDFSGVEELDEEQLDNIIENAVYDILNEGFDVEELDVIFEEVFLEAKVTVGAGGGKDGVEPRSVKTGSAKVTTGSGSKMAAKERLASRKAQKRAERIEKIKSSVKKTIAKVKAAPGEAKKAAKQKIKDVKQQSHVGAAKYATSRNLVKGAGLKTQSSKGRAELRSAVAKDVKSRVGAKIKAAAGKVKQKAASAAVSGYAAARSAKAGAKSAVGKAARSVSTGAGKVASRLGEDTEVLDLYDVVLEHLLDEGFADTEEAAVIIMANMSEEWREEIIESRGGYASNPAAGRAPESFHKLSRGVKKEKGVKGSFDSEGNIRGKYKAMQLKKRNQPPYNN